MRFTFALLLLLGYANRSTGQQLEMVGASGTYTVTAGLGISWTLGEVVTLTSVSPTEAVTQGFQQGDIWVVSVNDAIGKNLSINVFPNPVVNYVQIKTQSTIGLTILSTEGKLIQTKQINGTQTEIDMSEYSRGVYFFHFADSDGINFKIVRVIKN